MIYPKEFPPSRDNENAEKEVFNAMKRLPDSFDVFYNKTFSGRIRGEMLNYEIDFIVADLRNNSFNGLVFIEVKGGNVVYNSDNTWTQNGRLLEKSPTDQVISSMFSFIKNRYGVIEKDVYYGWMLCFPQGNCPHNDELPDCLNERQVIDKNKLPYLRDTLVEYFDFLAQNNPRPQGLDFNNYNRMFKSAMVRDCNFVLPLSAKLESDEQVFIKLTKQQASVLNSARENSKILVKGIAGSGKTIIAKEIAEEYYEYGFNVLFLCYNRYLALNIKKYFEKDNKVNISSIEKEIAIDSDDFNNPEFWVDYLERISSVKKNTTNDRDSIIRVERYHSFAYSIIEASEQGWWGRNFNEHDFWEWRIPDKILDIKKNNGITETFDVIIIDEGQDFSELWFETVDCFLKPEGKLYIFMDDLQNINQVCPNIPNEKEFSKMRLDDNCRNTKNIALELSEIVKGEIKSKDDMPEGEPVIRVGYKNDIDQQTKILNEIKSLVEDRNIAPDKILILLNTDKGRSCLAETKKVGNLELHKLNDSGVLINNAINYTHINTFKGLEADIVFIIDTDKVTYDEKYLYTQASRAKHLLYIFEKES